GRCGWQRIDHQAEGWQLADADHAVVQRGERVQRPFVLGRDVARRGRGVVLIEVDAAAAAQDAPAVSAQVVGEADTRRDVLLRRLRVAAVRVPDLLERLPRGVQRELVLVHQVEIDVITYAEV